MCLSPEFFKSSCFAPGGEGISTASEQEDHGAAAALGSPTSSSDS